MTHKYLAPNAPSFKMRIDILNKQGDVEDFKLKFEDGVYATDNDNVAAVLDVLLIKNKGLQIHFKKANMEEAAAMVAAHKKNLKARTQTGTFSSASLENAKRTIMHASGNAMEESAPNNFEQLAVLQQAMGSVGNRDAAADALIITEKIQPTLELNGASINSKLKL